MVNLTYNIIRKFCPESSRTEAAVIACEASRWSADTHVGTHCRRTINQIFCFRQILEKIKNIRAQCSISHLKVSKRHMILLRGKSYISLRSYRIRYP